MAHRHICLLRRQVVGSEGRPRRSLLCEWPGWISLASERRDLALKVQNPDQRQEDGGIL